MAKPSYNPIEQMNQGLPVDELALGEAHGLQDVVTGGTIKTDSPRVRITNTAGAATGMIMTPGRKPGQLCYVVNEGANTVTMAAAGTSNVRLGVTVAITTLRGCLFMWDGVSRWDAIVSA